MPPTWRVLQPQEEIMDSSTTALRVFARIIRLYVLVWIGAVLVSGSLLHLHAVSSDNAKFLAQAIVAIVCFCVAAWWVTAFWKMRGLNWAASVIIHLIGAGVAVAADVELGAVLLPIAMLVVALLLRGESGDADTTKTCPFCAESIKRAAVACKYCGRDLPETAGPSHSVST
jgi:hypothetical protein